ncbi:MAG: EamA family transporter [Candidatus Bipolaricaulota bacterium]|nr:EamA family transporter [Candidatus Bipolaricaulota bacterium]
MAYAVVSALLFGISAPLSKLLLAKVDPIALAGLVYLGAGAFLGILALLSRALTPSSRDRAPSHREAGLERQDLPWLAGAVVAGGVAGPILLLLGLSTTPAATASLLLNFEVVATALIAGALFREAVGWRTWAAVAAVSAGGALLSVDSSAGWGFAPGALLILAACAFWGLDNNLTRQISLRDPKLITTVKGLVAGSFSLGLAVSLGRPLPSYGTVLAALALGAACYGASIALFVRSLRNLGTARTGAVFAAAPFAGAVLSFTLFPEAPRASFYGGALLMVFALVLLLRERHAHGHTHEPIVHTHAHVHDEHHTHVHAAEIPESAQHTHVHTHAPLEHSHPHSPDAHHRHSHEPSA